MFDRKMAIFRYQHVQLPISRSQIRIKHKEKFFGKLIILAFQKNKKQFIKTNSRKRPSLIFFNTYPLNCSLRLIGKILKLILNYDRICNSNFVDFKTHTDPFLSKETALYKSFPF